MSFANEDGDVWGMVMSASEGAIFREGGALDVTSIGAKRIDEERCYVCLGV